MRSVPPTRRSRAASPIQEKVASGVPRDTVSDARSRPDSPFKLEKMKPLGQGRKALSQQRKPALDRLQGCTGLLIRCFYTNFFTSV